MKLTKVHFLAGGGVILAGVAGLFLLRGGDEKKAAVEDGKSPHSDAARAKLEAMKNQPMQAPVLEGKSVTSALRSFDKEIIEYLHSGQSPDKDTNDVLPRNAARVNAVVYTAEGDKPRIVRIFVDVDRDGRSDEMWRFDEQGNLMRRAMRPDAKMRNYRDLYYLEGDSWAFKGGEGTTVNLPEPTPEERAAATAARELRPIDKKIIELAKTAGPGPVTFQQPDGKTANIVFLPHRGGPNAKGISGAQVDLDGDGKFEETWSIGASGIRRSVGEVDVNPQDPQGKTRRGGHSGDKYALTGDQWKKI